jgi:hypothetical protein
VRVFIALVHVDVHVVRGLIVDGDGGALDVGRLAVGAGRRRVGGARRYAKQWEQQERGADGGHTGLVGYFE